MNFFILLIWRNILTYFYDFIYFRIYDFTYLYFEMKFLLNYFNLKLDSPLFVLASRASISRQITMERT